MISINSRQQLLKEHRIKVLLKENGITKILDISMSPRLNWFKHLIMFFILILLHDVSKIGLYNLLYILTYSNWFWVICKTIEIYSSLYVIYARKVPRFYERQNV